MIRVMGVIKGILLVLILVIKISVCESSLKAFPEFLVPFEQEFKQICVNAETNEVLIEVATEYATKLLNTSQLPEGTQTRDHNNTTMVLRLSKCFCEIELEAMTIWISQELKKVLDSRYKKDQIQKFGAVCIGRLPFFQPERSCNRCLYFLVAFSVAEPPKDNSGSNNAKSFLASLKGEGETIPDIQELGQGGNRFIEEPEPENNTTRDSVENLKYKLPATKTAKDLVEFESSVLSRITSCKDPKIKDQVEIGNGAQKLADKEIDTLEGASFLIFETGKLKPGVSLDEAFDNLELIKWQDVSQISIWEKTRFVAINRPITVGFCLYCYQPGEALPADELNLRVVIRIYEKKRPVQEYKGRADIAMVPYNRNACRAESPIKSYVKPIQVSTDSLKSAFHQNRDKLTPYILLKLQTIRGNRGEDLQVGHVAQYLAENREIKLDGVEYLRFETDTLGDTDSLDSLKRLSEVSGTLTPKTAYKALEKAFTIGFQILRKVHYHEENRPLKYRIHVVFYLKSNSHIPSACLCVNNESYHLQYKEELDLTNTK